jgi:predicted RNase H-like nuclease
VIVGIDCATKSRLVGLARAELRQGVCTLTDVALGGTDVPDVIGRWLGRTKRGLIALDAPLGWPLLLSDMLPGHRAGERLVGRSDLLFRRHTDEFIRTATGQRALDVAADRIARTAHSSLDLLARIRVRTQSEIPLAWSHDLSPGIHAIEVYPAATLVVHGLPSKQYKKPAQSESRLKIVEGLRSPIDLASREALLLTNSDALDAVVCVLAALDFLAGEAMPPTVSDHITRKEGWIWVRKRALSSTT